MTACLFAVLSLGFATAASAETINVTTTIDEFGSGSRCSLREAIWSANNDSNTMAVGCRAGSGADTIEVEAGRFGIDRTAPSFPNTAEDAGLYGDLDVTAPATIVHTGIRPATIVSEIPGERVFQILTSVTPGVALEGLTITGGSAPAGAEDHGGGILNGGLLTVRNSLIDDNTAIYGAGISTEGTSTATVTNTTISGNSANEDGGGLSVETGGTVSLVNDTVAGNTADSDNSGGGDGGGVFASTSDTGGVLNLRDVLVAGNTDLGDEANDCAKNGGAINSLKHNLIGDTNGCNFVTAAGDVTNRAPRIFGLADNGGPTESRSLNKISPAIDAGSSCPAADQRGVPRNLGGRCDIGAYELARCEDIAINRIGTGGPDLLLGTNGPDGILALGGNDTIRSGAGNDGLCGGAGSDDLEGGAGKDGLDGGAGKDTCLGGGGKNHLVHCELPKKPRHHGHRAV